MQDNHDPKAPAPASAVSTEAKDQPLSVPRPSRGGLGLERGVDAADPSASVLPAPLRSMLDLLAQVAQIAGDMQLEVLSRKGLRIASLPVSHRHLLFGVSIDGLFFVDRLLDQASPAIGALLRRFQQQQILQPGREEFPRPEVLEQDRSALLDLTARGLRGLAGRLGSSPVRVKQSPPGTTLGASANLRFSPIELLLNCPDGLSLREDVTSQLFQHPPQGTSDAWQFVIGSPGQLWPVATINTGLKSITDASNACQIAHQLLLFMQRQGITLSDGRQHAICLSGDGWLLLLVANVNQAVLLTLPAAQLGRVLQITQQSCAQLIDVSALATSVNPSPVPAAAPIAAPIAEPAVSPAATPVRIAPPAVARPARGKSSSEFIGAGPKAPELFEAPEPQTEPAAALPVAVPPEPVLSIRHLLVRAAERTLIKDLDLDIPSRGVFAIMGPGGAGKSTLLSVLSGTTSGLTQQGELIYRGRSLSDSNHPVVLGQKVAPQRGPLIDYLLAKAGPHSPRERLRAAELLRDSGLDRLRASLERPIESLDIGASVAWRLEILHALAEAPALLCVDEPTAAMEDEEAEHILDLLRRVGTQRTVLFITHNQGHARSTAHQIALLAAARLHGVFPTEEFFSDSVRSVVRDYVRTGGCHVPSPDAPVEHIDPDYLEPPQSLPSQISEPELPQTPPPTLVLWSHPNPVLTLRDFGLSMGERCRLSHVNLDLGAHGQYVLVCPDGTIRRLLHAYLTTGMQGKVATVGEAKLQGADLSEGHHAAAIELGVKLLMGSVREYLLSGNSQRMSLGSMEEKLDWIQAHLASQKAEDLQSHLNAQVLDLSSEQRRRLAIARAAASRPAVLCLDEPFQGLDQEGTARLLQALDEESKRRAVLLLVSEPISAWEQTAQHGYIHGEYLYASPPIEPPAPVESENAPPPEQTTRSSPPYDGKISAESHAIEAVSSSAGHRPLWHQSDAESESGSRDEEQVVPELPMEEPVAEPAVRQQGQGPRGFHWLMVGSLAGTPEPGVMQELDYDLSLLRTAGITLLVTLTETPLDDDALAAQGLKSLFFPIVDMHAPSLRAAYELCGLIDLQLARGERIAFHCKAGLGRTGTLLCSYLIWKGETAEAALKQARRVEPAWVQSKEQEQFLQAFEGFCVNQRQGV